MTAGTREVSCPSKSMGWPGIPPNNILLRLPRTLDRGGGKGNASDNTRVVVLGWIRGDLLLPAGAHLGLGG